MQVFIGAIGAFLDAITHGISVDTTSVLAAKRITGTPNEGTSLGRFVRFVLAVHYAIA